MKGLILAGGKGTRLRPLTIHTPKPIVPVANHPFLLYQIDQMKSAGIGNLILSLAYQPGKIKDLLGDGSSLGVRIRYAVEDTPLGTAAAFKNGEHWIDSTTVVFNGDVLSSVHLASVIGMHRERRAVATLVLVRVHDSSAYGVVETGPDGWVQRFIEKPLPGDTTCDTINAGMYVLEPTVLRYIPKGEPYSFEHGLFPALLEGREPVLGVILSDYWIDIGTPGQYLQAHQDILEMNFRSPLVSAVSVDRASLPEGVFLDERSIIGQNVTIARGAHIESSVVGPNCGIGAGTRVVRSVIWPESTIRAGASVHGSIIAGNCDVGRWSTLKPGVVLGDRTVITDYSIL